jgi:hypothetical protein
VNPRCEEENRTRGGGGWRPQGWGFRRGKGDKVSIKTTLQNGELGFKKKRAENRLPNSLKKKTSKSAIKPSMFLREFHCKFLMGFMGYLLGPHTLFFPFFPFFSTDKLFGYPY